MYDVFVRYIRTRWREIIIVQNVFAVWYRPGRQNNNNDIISSEIDGAFITRLSYTCVVSVCARARSPVRSSTRSVRVNGARVRTRLCDRADTGVNNIVIIVPEEECETCVATH